MHVFRSRLGLKRGSLASIVTGSPGNCSNVASLPFSEWSRECKFLRAE